MGAKITGGHYFQTALGLTDPRDAIDLQGCRDVFELMGTQVIAGKIPLHQVKRRGTDDEKIHQQVIAEILRDRTTKALDGLDACGLLGRYHLAPLFRVEMGCQARRAHQVTKGYPSPTLQHR